MEFEWDERKRARIIEERALDLASAYLFFDGGPAIHQLTPRNDEERWKTTAEIEGAFFTVVWTWRGETIRVISMRRAHAQEIRNTVKRTAAELRAMHRRGAIKSDWKVAAKKPLPSGGDPDDAMEEIDWLTTELPRPHAKAHMTLRVDADVLDWFRAQGKGYQTRINAILRRYYEQYTR